MKRFYEAVTIATTSGGSQVMLDDRPVRTPLKAPLIIPSEKIAERVAVEWNAQDKEIKPYTMPLTKLATTVIDLMPDRREPARNEISDYAATDLLCYRTPVPQNLFERQSQLWQPWLDWSAKALDAPMIVTSGIEPVDQPDASLNSLKSHITALDNWSLVGVHAATKLTGSVILALAIYKGELEADQAFKLAQLDELFEVERWGLEEEQEKRHQSLMRGLNAAALFLKLANS